MTELNPPARIGWRFSLIYTLWCGVMYAAYPIHWSWWLGLACALWLENLRRAVRASDRQTVEIR